MASPDGVAENVDDSASPSLGFNLSRRQEELMKKAERLMRAELDDILEDALNYAIMSRPTETPPHDPVSIFHEYLDKARQQADGADDVCLEAVPLEAERNEKHLRPPEVALQLRPLLLWLTKRAVSNKPQDEILVAYLKSEVKRVIDTPELKRDIWMATM